MRDLSRVVTITLLLVIFALYNFFASVEGGASLFAPNHRVNDDAAVALQDRVAAVADEFGNVYAVWQDAREGNLDVYFAKSTDGGLTFSPSRRVNDAEAAYATQQKPAIALGPDREIVVAWEDNRAGYDDFDIRAAISVDGGTTFTQYVKVSDGPVGTRQLFPSVAVDGVGNVFVAWQDDRSGNGDIRLAKAKLPTVSFSVSVRVDDDKNNGTQSSPSVAASSTGLVFVAYHDNRDGNANVYVARSVDGGLSFGPNVRIDDTGTSSSAQGQVSIGIDGLGKLYAVWQDNRSGDFDVYFAKSTDGGKSFSKNVRVDDGPRGTLQTEPKLTVGAAGTVYVVWKDERNTDFDIYFSYSVDGGATFSASTRVDDAGDSATNPAYQYRPWVVESKTGLVCVLWTDNRVDDLGDIYASTATFAVGAALRVKVSVSPGTVSPGAATNITVLVTSNGTGIAGATIALSANVSGTFGQVRDVGSGYYSSSFVPALVNATYNITITVMASKQGYLSGGGQVLLSVVYTPPPIGVSITAPSDAVIIGNTLELIVSVASADRPLQGASTFSGTSRGGSLEPTSGLTGSDGTWKTLFTPLDSAAGSIVTVAVSASKDGYTSGYGKFYISVFSETQPLTMSLSSDRHEMMSYETATITVKLTSNSSTVAGAKISASSPNGGNLSVVKDYGNGTYTFDFTAPKVTVQSWVAVYVTASKGAYYDANGFMIFLLDPNKSNPTNPTQLFVSGRHESGVVSSGEQMKVTVFVYTMEGYAVSGAKLSLALRDPNLGSFSLVVDELDGVYSFIFYASVVSGDTGVLIKIEASKYGYAIGTGKVGLVILA